MNGIIIINKPKGCTSHDIVYKIKKLSSEKVGHTGTLDPMAQGVLPILIGKATQCSKYLINHDKTYKVELELGKQTNTADIEGKIIKEEAVEKKILEEKNVEKTLKSMLGKQIQIPPIYSVIKVKGKKLYEYARKGQVPKEIKAREIEIYEIDLNRIDENKNIIEFTVKCSKGTYIRSLCEDIAKKLGTIGYMKNLIRITAGEFTIENSIEIEELESLENPQILEKHLISIEEFFKEKEKIELNEKRLKLFLNGVMITEDKKDDIYRIYSNNRFIGLGIIKNLKLKRDIII